MKKDKQQDHNKKRSVWSIIIVIIYGLSLAAFLAAILMLDILPIRYFAILAAVMAFISGFLFRGLLFSKRSP